MCRTIKIQVMLDFFIVYHLNILRMTTIVLLLLRTLSAVFYTFFVVVLPLIGIYRIQENLRSNLLDGIIMIGAGGAFFFLSLRYVKRKMLKEKSIYKEYGRSYKKQRSLS